MSFLRSIPLEEADGLLKQHYNEDLEKDGYVANTTRALSLRPQALSAVLGLLRVIKSNMDLRRYELVTITVASRLRCTY
jgi:hypothetical protein